MKTLANHTILYDAECPMCSVYTKAFVKSGVLSAEGRATYQQMPQPVCPLVDRQRAMDEIALINTETGEVTYGIRSIFKLMGHAFPRFQPLLNLKLFVGLMAKVYAFISYNRRVIIPANITDNETALQPTFKLHYRIAYLIFTWLVTGFVLTKYAGLLSAIVPLGGAYREYLICGGQMLFQGIVISTFARPLIWAYLGNMMTISFAGSLLLVPPVVFHHFGVTGPAYFYIFYFMAVAGLMFLEHIRRSKLLGLGYTLTVSWVLYRLLLLVLIFVLN